MDCNLPLLTAIMPTGSRADFALHAVALFQRQTYEPRELLILDDGSDDLQQRLPDDPRIRYERTHTGQSIGAKRNRACQLARGEFVIQWDDDDWYGPRRCEAQLEPLLSGRAEITALRTPLYYELEHDRCWTVTDALHSRLFVRDVHGGTLAFSRLTWERLAKYPNASLAEDAAFLQQAIAHGARLEPLPGEGLFVYVRHGTNAWEFGCGSFLDPNGWRPAGPPPFDDDDRRFYAAQRTALHPPRVTCVMPTCNRRAHVGRAIDFFMGQDYASRELVILDDGDDRVEDLVPDDPRVRYFRLDHRLVLGEKRNRACELARGEIIVHWDDDDWHAPNRISYQVDQLDRHRASICGLNRLLFFDPVAASAWLYEYPATVRRWIAGGSLCYRREAWEGNRFAHVAVGEDSRFVWSPAALPPRILDDHRFFAALIHVDNTSPKQPRPPYWQPWPFEAVVELLGADYDRYACC